MEEKRLTPYTCACGSDGAPTTTNASHDALVGTLSSMRDRGVKFLYGRWLIEGGPKVLLFDTGSVWNRLDEWKGDLWNLAGIPTPPNDTETNETLLLGYLVAWFLGEFSARERNRAIICHLHEWQAGLAIPLCRKRHIDVTTVLCVLVPPSLPPCIECELTRWIGLFAQHDARDAPRTVPLRGLGRLLQQPGLL